MTFLRLALPISLVLAVGCASPDAEFHPQTLTDSGDFGVLLMAHGGSPEWNQGVLAAVAPLREQFTIEVAFGMADAVSIQEAVHKLEAQGVRRIGVVRLFISGESWYDRTEQILGLRSGAPARPAPAGHMNKMGDMKQAGHGGHSMEFWQVESSSSFALSTQGLAEAQSMSAVLVDRARRLSLHPRKEDALILAHGPADDAENIRWMRNIQAHVDAIRGSLPFRSVRVETLREDWPQKRAAAELRIRSFVENAQDSNGSAIVIPFRVHGFGPYAQVLEGLEYQSDGQGLIPHDEVTKWIGAQIKALQCGSFRSAMNG